LLPAEVEQVLKETMRTKQFTERRKKALGMEA
jgi:hypothetical protein